MKSKTGIFFALLCFLSFVFFSCANQKQISGSYPEAAMDQKSLTSMDHSAEPGTGSLSNTGQRKIIQTAQIRIRVDNPKEIHQKIIDEVKALQGYVSFSQQIEQDHGINISLEVRVPAAKLEQFMLSLEELGKVMSQQLGTEEITKQYFDTKARLDNAIQQKDQYQRILLKAEKIEDILAVQREIDAVQERIEIYRSEIERWDLLVDFSTVSIELIPNPRIVEGQKKSAWNPLGWKQMWVTFALRVIQVANIIVHIIQWLIVNLAVFMILGILVWLAVYILKKQQKGKKGGK